MKLVWAILLAILSTAVFQADDATAQSYQLRSGDVLRVEVIEDPSLNRDVLVSPDGFISFPLAGTIRAGGRSITDVRGALTSALAGNFASPPNVFVALSSVADRPAPAAAGPAPAPVTYAIYFLGEVGSPGKIEVEPGTTILQAFALAGGFSDFAATKRIQLRRPDGSFYTLNYDAIESGRSTNGNVTIADGDTFVIPTRRLFE